MASREVVPGLGKKRLPCSVLIKHIFIATVKLLKMGQKYPQAHLQIEILVVIIVNADPAHISHHLFKSPISITAYHILTMRSPRYKFHLCYLSLSYSDCMFHCFHHCQKSFHIILDIISRGIILLVLSLLLLSLD